MYTLYLGKQTNKQTILPAAQDLLKTNREACRQTADQEPKVYVHFSSYFINVVSLNHLLISFKYLPVAL